ncbi:hypothetical protein ACHAXM_004697 [Skeletonema potamos]
MVYASNDRGLATPYPSYSVPYNATKSNNNLNGSSVDGSLSTSTNLGLRKRDGVAIIISLLLLRLAFTPPSLSDGGISSSFAAGGDSSISASMELAFYSPFQSTPPNLLNDSDGKRRGSVPRKREKTARPVPLDIDGDGIVESLVVPVFLKQDDITKEQNLELELIKANKLKKEHSAVVAENGWGGNEGSWGLRVLTLKLMHHRQQQQMDGGGGGTMTGPFAPRTLFLSPLLPHSTKKTNDGEDEHIFTSSSSPNIYPIKLLSVHIPIQRTHLGEEEKSRQRHKKFNEGGSSSSGGGYGKNNEIPRKDDPNFANYDHTRHYFCGRDWHHAANSCHKHCPDGVSSSCADGETCYADTPCDAQMHDVDSSNSNDTINNNDESTTMALTPRGTLPGIATVWSDGSVSLHVITADVPNSSWESDSTQHRPKRARQKLKVPELELRQIWRVYPLTGSSRNENSDETRDKIGGGGGEGDTVVFDELGITFESRVIFDENGETKKTRIGNNGAVLIGGKYSLTSRDGYQNPVRVSFHALDALDGTPLWELKGQHGGDKSKITQQDVPIPIIHTTSSARRRSHLPTADTLDPDLDNANAFIEGDDVMTSEECLSHFRASVLNIESGAMPHEFWDDGEYGSMSVGRFDRTRKSGGKRGRQSRKKGHHLLQNSLAGGSHRKAGARSKERTNKRAGSGGIALNKEAKRWQSDLISRTLPRRLLTQQRYNAKHPRMGKPNVVLFHGRDGLAVVSLKNGRPVCHISLTDHALYADLDQDGKLDTVQVVTSPEEFSSSPGVQSLIQKITGEKKDPPLQPADAPVICHAFVTSGLPPQEELFTAPLCLGGPSMSHRPQLGLSAAAPLLVEGSMGYGNDVVFAMNNGVISRYDSNGREIWRKKGGLKDGTPYWSRSDAAFLGRIQFGSVKESHSSVSASSHRNQHRYGSPLRPILLSGEEGAALLSPASGRVLSSVAFPQPVTSQPLLGDFNGDGTYDLLVVSADGLWGYRVVVETGRSGFFRIVVVTLLIGIAISALVQKTSQQPGQYKRSFDA